MTTKPKEGCAPDLLIETSWEVCNKVGGIYTVLSTKAKTLQQLYKDKVVFIGPDVWTDEHPSPFFKPVASLLQGWRRQASLPEGVSVRVGRWEIPGRPIAILVKFDSMYAVKDELYGHMWELYGVDSLHAYGDYDEACAFSHAAGIVIESLCKWMGVNGAEANGKKVIAHFDEWTTGMALLYTQWRVPAVATVFTTHATSIGRSICGNNKPLYDYLRGYDGDQMAAELNLQSKHSLEKAAAHAADCFTTVSDITAIECEQLLQRRPTVVTPNGFEKGFVPAANKFDAARQAARKRLLDVARDLTGRQLADDTFIVATSGRCEYRNKGIDVFLDAMNELRHLTDTRVLALTLVPAWVAGPREDLRLALERDEHKRLADPVITHTLHNAGSDAILGNIHRLGFTNDARDTSLTIIDVPCYLNGDDGIFNTSYYDLLIGLDATVFPSYYEPWGYTPLESVAFGVPTVTTSLSGFGRWIMSLHTEGFEASGVEVVPRCDGNYQEVVGNIASSLLGLIAAPAQKRADISHAASSTAEKASWEYFISYYIKAYDIALSNAAQRIK